MGFTSKDRRPQLRGVTPELLDTLENVAIAYSMGWDMDGVIEVARGTIAKAHLQQFAQGPSTPESERNREPYAPASSTPKLLEENEQLKVINAELVEMLDHAVERGLIYWEPQTTRGTVAKVEMIEKARAVITKAQQVH